MAGYTTLASRRLAHSLVAPPILYGSDLICSNSSLLLSGFFFVIASPHGIDPLWLGPLFCGGHLFCRLMDESRPFEVHPAGVDKQRSYSVEPCSYRSAYQLADKRGNTRRFTMCAGVADMPIRASRACLAC